MFAMLSAVKSTNVAHHLTHVALAKGIVTMTMNVVVTQSVVQITVGHLFHQTRIAAQVNLICFLLDL